MSKPSAKKAAKQKDRAERVKKKLDHLRKVRTAEAKKKAEWEARMEAETNPNGRKQKPFRRNPTPLSEEEFTAQQANDAEVRAKLEHNLKLLEALEQQYQAEQKARLEANQQLEGEGAVSMKEKLARLQEKLHDEHGLDTHIDLSGLVTQEAHEQKAEQPTGGRVIDAACGISTKKKG